MPKEILQPTHAEFVKFRVNVEIWGSPHLYILESLKNMSQCVSLVHQLNETCVSKE